MCGRCFRRVRAMLEETPDLLAHIRALTNPLKGTQYDKEPGGGGKKAIAPPPIPVELLDAADYVVTLLWSTLMVVRGIPPVGRMQVPVDATATDVLVWSSQIRDEILGGLHELSARDEFVALAASMFDRPASHEWSLAMVFQRWSLVDSPWWAAQPCPVVECGLRAVKVTPPALPGDETQYKCAKCGWCPPSDDDGFWAECFSRREGKAA